jgi:hypothetical protein
MRPIICSLTPAILFFIAFQPGVVHAQSYRFESNIGERTIEGETYQSERDEQEALFNYYFRDRDLTFETRFDELSQEASVPAWRIPYSAHIHPESGGGLSNGGGGGRPARPLRSGGRIGLFARIRMASASRGGGGSSALATYDRAFNNAQDLANSYEANRLMGTTRGLFGVLRTSNTSESWEGYCSGFTASTIRHPEPIRTVDAGEIGGTPGIKISPAETKALLACIYNRTIDDSYLYLAPPSAADGGPNMGTFHLALTNYIGQAGHPIGLDRTKGRVSWNNPVYSYKVNSIRDSGESNGIQFKTLETTITYTYYGSDNQMQTDLETGERVGNRKQAMTIRYMLALDEGGNVVGGTALNSAGHFLWVPLYAVQARRDGSAPGNPYVDVRKVLDLAAAAALPQVQSKFEKSIIGPRLDPALSSDDLASDTQ